MSATDKPRNTSAPCSAAPFVNHAFAVAHEDVLALHAQATIEAGARDGCRAGSIDHHANVFNALAVQFQGVQQAGSGDDGSPVLVVVHHGDIQLFFQATFYFKTFGGFDVLQVDASESRGNHFHGADKFIYIFGVHFDVKHIDVGKYLEQQSFPFHDRLARQGADVAQAEHCRAVGNHCH